MEGWICLAVFYAIAGCFGATAYPYVKTGNRDAPVLGIERVGGFLIWWLILPAAAGRCVWDVIKATVEWLFTKS